MSLYAIGDVHGCYDRLCQLLDQIAFDPQSDTLWFVGDLVNRGPNSLDVLRFVKSLGERAACVLGNHDFHFMRVAAGISKMSDAGMQAVLAAADCDALLDWLYHRPLAICDHERKLIMVHAGLFPQWSLPAIAQLSDEVSAQLTDDSLRMQFLAKLYGDCPSTWDDDLEGMDRFRFAVNVMTRMRYLNKEDMRTDFSCAESPESCPSNLSPWYTFAHQRPDNYTVLFGHWAAHGFKRMDGYIAMDSGCVWGNRLTAIRLDRDVEKVFQVQCD